MGPGDLERLLTTFPEEADPRVLSSLRTGEDAGVFLLDEDLALVQTVDFFPPVVDDPYLFGGIAAANALSDVYAMGGRPLTALNLVTFPSCLDLEVLEAILAGGREKVIESGAVVLGGHTIEDDEPKYGLSVTGTVRPSEIMRISGARPGDALVLTKPVGSGVLATALKAGFVDEDGMRECVESMLALNAGASELLREHEASACTDVTGFGLVGHLREMLLAGAAAAELWFDRVPVLEGALDMARRGTVPEGARRNREYAAPSTAVEGDAEDALLDCLFDPQTSGGLLASVEASRAGALVEALRSGPAPGASVIGVISDDGREGALTIRRGGGRR